MKLSPEQQEATDKFLDFLLDPYKKEMVIEGYPGCGKSFLTKYLLEVARSQSNLLKLVSNDFGGLNVLCTATTNKATNVLFNFIGEATETIHKALSLKVSNNERTGTTSLRQTKRNTEFVKNTLIIIDEASYIDSYLLKLIRQNTYNCKILYIGDRYQLTSFKEVECPVFKEITLKVTLKGSERFTKDGAISKLAEGFRTAVDTGVFPKIVPDNKVIFKVNGSNFRNMIETDYTRPDFELNDAKVIAWSNNTVEAYNQHIRKLHTSSSSFVIGEDVITNKPIFGFKHTEAMAQVTDIRSDIQDTIEGWTINLDHSRDVFQPAKQSDVKELLQAEAITAKENNDWRLYFQLKGSFADLRATHACTVYKAQGSTYNTVYIDLNDIGKCHQPVTVARMLHVAVTRASHKVILYGELPKKYQG